MENELVKVTRIEEIHWVPWLCGQTRKHTVIWELKALTTVNAIGLENLRVPHNMALEEVMVPTWNATPPLFPLLFLQNYG